MDFKERVEKVGFEVEMVYYTENFSEEIKLKYADKDFSLGKQIASILSNLSISVKTDDTFQILKDGKIPENTRYIIENTGNCQKNNRKYRFGSHYNWNGWGSFGKP